jgi:hypothetical protein
MNIKKIVLLPVFLIVLNMNGQVNLKEDRNVFSVYYTPEFKGDNLFSYQKSGVSLSLPPLAFNRLTFYSTLGLEYHQFSYKNGVAAFSEEMEKFYNVQYSLLVKFQLSKNWSLNTVAIPRVVSNFNNGINSDNVDINGVVFVEKKFNSKKPNRYFHLMVGVGYLTLAGKTTINPVVNFMGKLNEHVSFVIGIPNTYVKYNFNRKHSLRVLGELNDFTSHINKTLFVDVAKTQKIDKTIFTEASVGLEYNYWLTKSIGILLRGTHTVFSEYKLEDVNEQSLFDFNSTLKPYVSLGIKFNPFR